MAFRFIHTADLHLDSPLRSLSLRNAELAALVGDASRQALTAIVDLALEERVDAVLIAGDLYDGDQTSMKTARFLATELERLHRAGIETFIIRGNHDALSKITRELLLPPSVMVFDRQAEVVERRFGSLGIAIHGLSFAKPLAPESLLPRYKSPVPGLINIGLMHTSLAGAPGHDAYAPCSVADLQAYGFDYWALGHIHKRSHHHGNSHIVMAGIPQGRDINEDGAQSVSLVTVRDDRTIAIEERHVAVAQFERVAVDLNGTEDWRDAISRISDAVASARDRIVSPHLVARLRLTGATPLSFRLRRDPDLLLAEAEQRAEQIGSAWIEKIELETHSGEEEGAQSADPVAELAALIRDRILTGPGYRESLRQLTEELLDDLPPESRSFAGSDESAFAAFLDQLSTEATETIIARMKTAERSDG